MNRRTFLLGTLKTAGAAALISQLDTMNLLAVPPEPTVPEAWTWDGSPLDYLRRLNALTARELGRLGVSLVHLPRLTRLGCYQNGTLATYQFHAAWKLPIDWRIGGAGLSPNDPRKPVQPVCEGGYACLAPGDPVNLLEQTARGYAEKIAAANGVAFGDLPLPMGVTMAFRSGLFRLVSAYELVEDRQLFRVDALIGCSTR